MAVIKGKRGLSELADFKFINGEFTELNRDRYYKISNYDQMEPFFMTITSPGNHWMYISSTGGLTAGRIDSENAIFPYYTDDKITESFQQTGSKTIIRLIEKNDIILWEPFSDRYEGLYRIERNLYKTVIGNSIVFQEINHDLKLAFQTEWTTSPKYGIIKRSRIKNFLSDIQRISILDGIQNTLPAMVSNQMQNEYSNLLDAYKIGELESSVNLGIFTLSATPTDKAEPSESIGATTWWQRGLYETKVILSSEQLRSFRRTGKVAEEIDVKGKRCAYMVQADLVLHSQPKEWLFCGEVNQTHKTIHQLIALLSDKTTDFKDIVETDIVQGKENLQKIIGINDGLQKTGNELTSSHYSVNIMFNVMRGGYFAKGYFIDTKDLRDYVKEANNRIYDKNRSWFSELKEEISLSDLDDSLKKSADIDLIRLIKEYLPITFNRRHGDPSRPWNRFTINTTNEDGTPKIDYQGNWRDIFQNWEALLLSNPAFVFGVIFKFLNAITADGYNPYHISRQGIGWEKPEPDNPMANIGYWSDHQIIYLEKLMEVAEKYFPGELANHLNEKKLVYADVPYEIKSYEDLTKNPRNTIDFNWDKDRISDERVAELGFDGRLLTNGKGDVIHTNMIEKLLIILLAKVTNFIPEGGIWMNTQRPEWNDANNALVGYGISMVTLSYLIRYVDFLQKLIPKTSVKFKFHEETANWLSAIRSSLESHKKNLYEGFDNKTRLALMNELGKAGSDYRTEIYKYSYKGIYAEIGSDTVSEFLQLVDAYFKETLKNNLREDGLYNSYNRLELTKNEARIHQLYEMLEGQVASLSSNALLPKDGLKTLIALQDSAIYRQDQDSYMLYPNRKLPRYLATNTILEAEALQIGAVKKILSQKKNPILDRNNKGHLHFNWKFRNNDSLLAAVKKYNTQYPETPLSKEEIKELQDLFESIFNHCNFTGRSGTIFAYEGLGSIYWHMVAKLLLVSQDLTIQAEEMGEKDVAEKLKERYFRIRDGIGFNKPPKVYGAFPIDPYSHTPWGSGAKQPGMTGQVKEEVITRFAEMGLIVKKGRIHFSTLFVKDDEYLRKKSNWIYYDVSGVKREITLKKDSYGFTFCQLPVIVGKGETNITIYYSHGKIEITPKTYLNRVMSKKIFLKTGEISRIDVDFND